MTALVPEKCLWKHDKYIGRWFLPYCIGGAVYGPEGCTCNTPRVNDRIQKLENELADVKAIIGKLAIG